MTILKKFVATMMVASLSLSPLAIANTSHHTHDKKVNEHKTSKKKHKKHVHHKKMVKKNHKRKAHLKHRYKQATIHKVHRRGHTSYSHSYYAKNAQHPLPKPLANHIEKEVRQGKVPSRGWGEK